MSHENKIDRNEYELNDSLAHKYMSIESVGVSFLLLRGIFTNYFVYFL